MAKEYQFNWRPPIPPALAQGTVFDRYDDESTCLESAAHVRIDEFGFYMYWMCEGRDAVVLDLATVWEARPAGLPKDGRILFELEQKGARETIEERTVWITHGSDLVTVSSFYLVADTIEQAKEWQLGINEILRNMKVKHTCPTTSLMKYWRWLCLSVNDRRKIPIKNIIKTFASGKPEKMVHKCLCDLGLGGDKEREELDVELFTFEKFLRLYHKICPRTDVQELFVKLSGQKEYLTKDRIISFLNDEQRDPRLNEILFPFFDNARVQQLIAKYETDSKYIDDGKMSGDAFLRFLMSDENAPVHLDRIEMYQDMDQPLCHYYINSSHNTYLTGRQYGGKSSSEIYRQVLLTGCRCIELDCWDGTGENKGEPIITHGKAMCTDVFFKDVLYQIRDTAFARSDFPVILSFENHCSKSNQLKMAKYCLEIFGDMLLSKQLDDFLLEAGVPLPSPNRLKRKILIKNKRLKAEIEKHQMEQFMREGKLDEDDELAETPEVVGEDTVSPPNDGDDTSDDDDTVAGSRDVGRAMLPPRVSLSAPATARPSMRRKGDSSAELDQAHPELAKQNFISKLKPLGFAKKQELDPFDRRHDDGKRSFRRPTAGDHSDSAALLDLPRSAAAAGRGGGARKKPVLTKEEEERIFAEYHYTGATTNIHPLLSSLVNYTHPVKFSGFDIAENNNLHFHMSSFSESTGLGYLKQSAPEFVNYNKRQLSRIYPKGARVDSSNFLPQIFWNAGCQMVSLNFQTPDVYMQLNQGKFEYNGSSGYLLKPDFMRRPDRTFDPFSESPVDGVIAAHCSVRVISGQFLCERKVGTYVEVEMYGLPTDTIRKEHRTKTVPANGLNPVYNEDPFVFRKVVLPDLAVLRFAVYEESGKQLGQRILPLDGLQAGYRHISLRTESNQACVLPTLFVQIVIKTYVPEELSNLVNALADPRAFLSAQQKRQEALHNMGVDDTDIAEVPAGQKTAAAKARTLQKANGSAGNLLAGESQSAPTSARQEPSTSAAKPPGTDANTSAVDKFKVDPIEVADLRKDKAFQKLEKKYQKDIEDLKKKHQKQRDTVQKQQQTHVDKMIAVNRRSSKKSSRRSKDGTEEGELANTDRVKSLVSNQTDEWSTMVRRHESEEFEMRRAHVRDQYDVLRKLLGEAQKTQMASLKQRLEAENKDLKQTQTKKSMEDSKAIQMDKNIKTKAERDRRVKELNEKNLKMFVEERKRLAMKAQKHEEQLAKRHQDQFDLLEKEAAKAAEQEEQLYREELLASRPESVV